MGLFLLVCLLFTLLVVVPVGVVLTLVLVGTRSMKRANRVAPNVPTQVPNLWRWTIGYGARLHRRLQRVAGLARSARAAAGAGGVGIGDLAADVERQACALDDQVALGRYLPSPQRIRRYFDLERSVAELEMLAMRITILAGQVASGVDERAVPLADRVRHLEEAVAEVHAIEAEALGEARALSQGAWLPPARPITSPAPEPVRRPRP
ncbi:MAG: hypothetical protein ABIS47_09410 [Acidimicrobiales bacterium]